MNNWFVFRDFILFFLAMPLFGCSTTSTTYCDFPCQLGVDQNEELTVQNLIEILSSNGWIAFSNAEGLTATYEADVFSGVLETKTIIELDEPAPEAYQPAIILYIGYIGGANLDNTYIPSESVNMIQIESSLNVLQSLLKYGLPQGGSVLPIIAEDEKGSLNTCPQHRHYIAYYDDGRTIVRATVDRPLLLNLWTSEIELVYAFGDILRFSSANVGVYEPMYNRYC